MYSVLTAYFGVIAILETASATNCPCGWRVPETSVLFTHRIHDDFSKYLDTESLVHDSKADAFTRHWYIYDYEDQSFNTTIRLNAKYEAKNLRIRRGNLELHQRAYTDSDRQQALPISVSGIQTKRTDILHGSFRIRMKMTGASGGSCGSFFWYHDNSSEIDIEAVSQGTSLVNNTINYTLHPSLDSEGYPIENATLSVPMESDSRTITTLKEHRFDCSPSGGVKYFLDGQMRHSNQHNIPHAGGNLQLKLWADGNQWWSGVPSTTEVTLSVASITAYFNTTRSDRGEDLEWLQQCQRAGGPSNQTVCNTLATSEMPRPWSSSGATYHDFLLNHQFWSCTSFLKLLYAWSIIISLCA